MRHDGQASDDEEEVEEEDEELLEDNDQHSHQEADLGPDSNQEAELDEAEDHNDELETLQNILLIWLCECYREICNIHRDEQHIIHIPETLKLSFYVNLDICDLIQSKWHHNSYGYTSWDYLILILARKCV